MKVVWLCHFSNQEVQHLLKPYKQVNEIAPWITSLAKIFEDLKDFELHIVSPCEYSSVDHHFVIRGIHYHFFNAHIPGLGRHWPGIFKLDYWTDFYLNKLKVRKIIKSIAPDILHLHGAEIANYSSTILQFINIYPVLVTIQGFISKTEEIQDYQLRKAIKYEKQILETFSHFGYRTKTMADDIRSFNPNAILHWHDYPYKEIIPIDTKKEFDIVFFARVSKDKGIEDLLKAIYILKRKMPGMKVCIIGAGSSAFIGMSDRLGLSDNIYWAGFLPTQNDVHKLASSAKISVLPTYHDIISGTVTESIFLKIPVVAYSVGSIPEINEKEECISLVNKGDVNALAEKILWLLINPEIRKLLSERAYKRANEMFDNKKVPGDVLKAYKEVIHDFKKN
jgi:glycosyltransferase involved in cell wall biosynthesis